MRQLIYISNVAGDFVDAELPVLVARAAERNRQDAITGFLLFNGRNFLHFAEGPDVALDHLMGRLKADPRHDGMVTLDNRDIAERCCPDWPMELIRTGGVVAGRRERLEGRVPASLDPRQRELVLNFAHLA